MFHTFSISELLEIQSQSRSGCFTTREDTMLSIVLYTIKVMLPSCSREGYHVIRCVVYDKGNAALLLHYVYTGLFSALVCELCFREH
jgi:hypothetical protein